MIKLKTRARVWVIMLAAALLAGAQGHDDAITSLLLALVILLPVAKLAGTVAEKLGQPAVMGELLAVLILGNLELVGVAGVAFLKTDAGLEILAQLGVIFLFFEIGLDAGSADLMTLAVKGERILDEALFSAILIMVMATTIVTPPLIQWSFGSLTPPEKNNGQRIISRPSPRSIDET